ncbi:unannotated protein [freshwater metagenome]|uniref:Unannotated protein n=1 Tax=freshwater metagenome TaxID=449393 RepID=A0A6J6ER81_9ZZZZ
MRNDAPISCMWPHTDTIRPGVAGRSQVDDATPFVMPAKSSRVAPHCSMRKSAMRPMAGPQVSMSCACIVARSHSGPVSPVEHGISAGPR